MVLENQKTSKSGSRFPTVPWARDLGMRLLTQDSSKGAALPRRVPQASGSCIYGIISGSSWVSSQDRRCQEKGNMSFPTQGWREERLCNNRNFKEGKIHYRSLRLKQIGDILFPHHPYPCHFIEKVLKSGVTDWLGKLYTVVSKPKEAFFMEMQSTRDTTKAPERAPAENAVGSA